MIDDEELKRYSKSWHRPAVSKDLDKYDSNEEDTNVRVLYEPRGAQIEALCALESTRAEGAKRALVQAATGVGKTYLAAFDSKDYEHVLFVAHREEILEQAAMSFKNVRNSDDFGFFKGSLKETDKEHVKKIIQMPVHFLQESGKGFFVKRDGCALALREELPDVIINPVFAEQMKDVIEYRAMDYYHRRYRENAEK